MSARSRIVSQVTDSGYVDVCPCDDEQVALLTARDLSLSLGTVAVHVEDEATRERTEIARYERGVEMIGSVEAERVVVHVSKAGAS